MCRISPILHLAPDAAHVVAIVGAATAFLGATIACAQDDIKKILAYSTISQLGFMFLAAGVGAYVAAIFLMLTHAFYKALLFLGAGSVIHAMNDDQDTKHFGALAKVMPVTAVTFLIAWLSIGGVPPFSGFWSKGDVLMNAFHESPLLYAVGAVSAILTAYYLGRCYLLTFRGQQRWVEARRTGDGTHGSREQELHPHDPGWTMRFPLVVLAVASVLGGLINLPFHPLDFLARWLNPVVGPQLLMLHYSAVAEWGFALGDIVLAALGVSIALGFWSEKSEQPSLEPTFLRRAWFIDATYDRVIARPSTELAQVTADDVETKVIDGAVNGFAGAFAAAGRRLRTLQTGYVRNYALGLMGGLVVVLAYVVVRATS
jgi:NADH-quinone oxidoreductase subunit L